MGDFHEAVAAARAAHRSANPGELKASSDIARPEKISGKVYGVMAATTALTFATLTTGYQLFFTHHLYA